MSKHTGQKDTALRNVEKQLQRLLSPPLFIGATPSTPFRIATLVDNEIRLHASLYIAIEHHARPLLADWFAAHPADVLQQRARDVLVKLSRASITAKELDRATMKTIQAAVVELQANWDTAFLPLQEARAIIKQRTMEEERAIMGQPEQHADVASALLVPPPSDDMSDGAAVPSSNSSAGSAVNAMAGMRVARRDNVASPPVSPPVVGAQVRLYTAPLSTA